MAKLPWYMKVTHREPGKITVRIHWARMLWYKILNKLCYLNTE